MNSNFADRWKRAPPLASIESLLSFEAKSTPRSENNTIHEADNLEASNATYLPPHVGACGSAEEEVKLLHLTSQDNQNQFHQQSIVSTQPPPTFTMQTMNFEDFQRLPSDKQSEEIFKLLSMLSPFASEVSSLRSSMESALNRISELEMAKSSQNLPHAPPTTTTHHNPTRNAGPNVFAKNDDKVVLSGTVAKTPINTYGMGGLSGAGMGLAATMVGVAGFGASAMMGPPVPPVGVPGLAASSEADTFAMRDKDGPESPYSNTPLDTESQVPEPFIITKSRQLNKRVTLNVGGVRHEVMWKILENVPRSRLGKYAIDSLYY